MSNEEAESWIGLTVTLTESAVVFGDYSCRDAAYQSRQVSGLDFFKNSRFDLKDLGILAEEAQDDVADDLPPTLSILDAAVTEGTGVAVSAVFPLELSGPSGREIQVGYATADVTAVAVDDYQSAAGIVIFPAGTTTQAITVAVAGDALDEDDETFATSTTSRWSKATVARPTRSSP